MSTGDIAALAVVAACALWVGWMAWRKLRGRPGCGCGHCPSGKKQA